MFKLIFCAGLLTAALWLVINFILTLKLLNVALLKGPKTKLSGLLLIKFPLLYLLGFLILASRVFSALSLVLGLGLGILVIGVKLIWARRTQPI